jgi:hypothetical protein
MILPPIYSLLLSLRLYSAFASLFISLSSHQSLLLNPFTSLAVFQLLFKFHTLPRSVLHRAILHRGLNTTIAPSIHSILYRAFNTASRLQSHVLLDCTGALNHHPRMASGDATTSPDFKTKEIVVGIFVLLVIIEGVLFCCYCSIQLWKGTWVWPGWKNENRIDVENTHRNSQSDSEMEYGGSVNSHIAFS